MNIDRPDESAADAVAELDRRAALAQRALFDAIDAGYPQAGEADRSESELERGWWRERGPRP